MFRKLSSMLFVFLLVLPLSAQPSEPINIAVMDLTISGGVPESYKVALSDRLRQELFKTGAFTVVERSAMEEILSEQGFQASGCTTDECAVQMGLLLGVERIVAGSLAKIGETHTISIRMIEVATGKILMAESEDCSCPIDQVLTVSLRNVAGMLAQEETGNGIVVEETGILEVITKPRGAKVILDGYRIKGTTPLTIDGLSVGEHYLVLQKEGYAEIRRSVIIEQNKKTKFKEKLPLPGSPVKVEKEKVITKSGAVLRSAIIPGFGQYWAERKIPAGVYLVGEIAAVGFLVYAISNNSSLVDDYDQARYRYQQADAYEVDARRKEMETAWTDADDSKSLVVTASAVLAGWHLVNIVDAVLFTKSEIPTGDPFGSKPFISPALVFDSRGDATPGIKFSINGLVSGRNSK